MRILSNKYRATFLTNLLGISGFIFIIFCTVPLAFGAKEAAVARWKGPEIKHEQAAVAKSLGKQQANPQVSSAVWIAPGMPKPKPGTTKPHEELAVTYVTPEDKDFLELAKVLQESKGIDKIVEAVNKTYDFPHVDVVFDMCGQANAFYDSETKRIILCYELVAALANGFRQDEELSDEEVGNQVVASLIFTFFHELGHAAIHLFDLPLMASEEDAADRFATLILLSGDYSGDDDEVDLAENALGSFDLETASSLEELDFADEHPVDEQRWYTMACLMVGSDPEKYGYLVGDNGLPSARAENCPAEYEKVSKSWGKLMHDHLKRA